MLTRWVPSIYPSAFLAPASSTILTICWETSCPFSFSLTGTPSIYKVRHLPYRSSLWICRFTCLNDITCWWSICFSEYNFLSTSFFSSLLNNIALKDLQLADSGSTDEIDFLIGSDFIGQQLPEKQKLAKTTNLWLRKLNLVGF